MGETSQEVVIGWPLLVNRIRWGVKNHTFGMVRHAANGQLKPHQGWDLFAVPGTPVYAAVDGKVHIPSSNTDFGLQIMIECKRNGETIYPTCCHLQEACVVNGDFVKRGRMIGRSGTSGNAAGMTGQDTHVHYEIRTVLNPPLGLAGRMDPQLIYGTIPYGPVMESYILTV